MIQLLMILEFERGTRVLPVAESVSDRSPARGLSSDVKAFQLAFRVSGERCFVLRPRFVCQESCQEVVGNFPAFK